MRNTITAMIPAKLESQRLRRKNLALIDGHPLIYYAIKAAKESHMFERVVVNSDHEIFGDIAKRYNVDFYKRPASLGSQQTKSDEIVHDFLQSHPCDTLVWVNAISPLQTAEDIRKAFRYFQDNGLDTLITTKIEQVHCLFDNQPVNFQKEERFARTQDLIPVQPMIYSVMIWNTKMFLETYREKKYGLLSGKIGFYPIDKQRSIIVKTQEDLELAEHIMKMKRRNEPYRVKYDPLLDNLKEK